MTRRWTWLALASIGLVVLLGLGWTGQRALADEADVEGAGVESAAASETASDVDEEPAAASSDEAPEDPVGVSPSDSQPPPTSALVESASRVRVKLDVEGELFATAGRDAPPVRRPISVDACFDFIESPPSGAADRTVVRRYRDATADLRIDGEPRRTSLAADARTLRVSLRGTTPLPYLDDAFLSRDERDLLETPFDPLLLDALRPAAPVVADESWDVPADVVAGLLAIDTVESGGITARLADVADGVATVRIAGIVDGAADGVPAHVTVDGSFTVSATSGTSGSAVLDGRVAGVTVTLRERREASHVAPGFDVEARLAIARAATDEAAEIDTPPNEDAATPHRRRGPGRAGLVWHRDAAGRYDLVHDDRWRVIEDGADGLVMRMVDSGALVAQCVITPLSRAAAGSAPAIAEVERDIERSLAGQFGRIEHASEAERSDGVRIARVVTSGRADGLPFRWIHQVLTDAAGHRLSVTCMLEASMEKRFGNADRELVDGVGLPGGAAADGERSPGDRAARLPTESRMP